MDGMNKHLQELQRTKVAHLQSTTGEVKYYTRFNPELYGSETPWRQCTPQEYFRIIDNDYFGGFLEVKTTLDYYHDGRVREVML